MELKAGMFIAQGPNTNVLLLLGGEAPMLEVLSAIDLNLFQRTGEAKRLDKLSPEVVDIIMHPEQYTFALPSITDTINSIGFTRELGNVKDIDQKEKDEILAKGLSYYKAMLPFGLEQAKVKTKLYLLRECGIRMEQANYFFTLIAKVCNKPLV